jgi:hypothetical protein
MQHFLKSATGAAGTEIVSAQFLEELFFAWTTRKPGLDFGFGRESFTMFAAWLKEIFDFHGSSPLDGLPVTPEGKAVPLF